MRARPRATCSTSATSACRCDCASASWPACASRGCTLVLERLRQTRDRRALVLEIALRLHQLEPQRLLARRLVGKRVGDPSDIAAQLRERLVHARIAALAVARARERVDPVAHRGFVAVASLVRKARLRERGLSAASCARVSASTSACRSACTRSFASSCASHGRDRLHQRSVGFLRERLDRAFRDPFPGPASQGGDSLRRRRCRCPRTMRRPSAGARHRNA